MNKINKQKTINWYSEYTQICMYGCTIVKLRRWIRKEGSKSEEGKLFKQ